MRKIIFIIAFLFSASLVYSQGATSTPNCYDDWYTTFQKYGATVVADGTHEIIVVIKKESRCDCLIGQIQVRGGKLVANTLLIQQEDGTFERPDRTLSPKYKVNPDAKVERWISNGMSPTYLTNQDELVHLFFYKNLNKIPRKQKKAPMPSEIGFN